MYKLNTENPVSKHFLKFAWFLTKQDLGINSANSLKELIKI